MSLKQLYQKWKKTMHVKEFVKNASWLLLSRRIKKN